MQTSSKPVVFLTAVSILKTLLRVALGAALLFAGISHLTVARTEFLAQVPTWLPVDGDLVVVLSGIVEITLGLALIVLQRWRVAVGLAAALFFILIFPGNISQYTNRIDAFGLDTDQARFTRLFFQPVLVLWALWSTGGWRALWQGRKRGDSLRTILLARPRKGEDFR